MPPDGSRYVHGHGLDKIMRHSPGAIAFAAIVVVALRVGGGSLLLLWLDAPSWAVALWLMMNVRLTFTDPRKRA